MKKIFLTTVFSGLVLFAFSQKRDYQWFFDFQKAMHFNSGPPTVVAGAALTAFEGSGAMADSVTGALLFYMDNDTVYDNTHQQMPNGKGLKTSGTATQILTLPMPGNLNKYYIITNYHPSGWAPPDGVSYSVVDMTLNGGKGDIVPGQKTVVNINPGMQMSEGLTAIKHANGYDWWVLAHGGIPGQNGKRYYKFLITSAGVQPVTTQDIGTDITNGTSYLVASQDGNKVCRVDIQGHINLFDFDRCTGTLSNFVDMSEPYNGSTGTGSFYGCAFSPDSKVLYVTCYFVNQLYQFDLTAANIPASKNIVYNLPKNAGFGGMQLAPDGKIYFVHTNTKLCAINNPNVLGAGCNPATVAALPWNIVNFFIYFPNYDLGPTTTNAVASNDTTICNGGNVQISVSTASSYTWAPASGLSCVTCQNPVASPTTTTTYTVFVSGGCGSSIDSVKVSVVNALSVNAGTDLSICAGSTITLSGNGNGSYSWSPSTGLSNSSIANPTASPTANVTYTLTVSSGSCPPVTDDVSITVSQPAVANAGANQTACAGSTVTLSATGGGTYSWIPASGITNPTGANPTVSPTANSTYSVIVQVPGNCPADTDAVSITVTSAAIANAGNDQTICTGNTASLNATGGGTYSWLPATGLSNPSIANPTVSPSTTSTYSVVVQLGSCPNDTDIVTVVVTPFPVANAGSSVTIVSGASTQLNGSGGAGYQWSPSTGVSNPNIANPTTSPTVTTTYCVFVTNGTGCQDSACVTVYVTEPVPCGPFYLPNAFSPNGDGDNDEFKAYIDPTCIDEFKITIYNRWGIKVFESNDITKVWSGDYNSTDANAAVYTYFCRAVLSNGKEIKMEGNVSLVR